MKKGVLLISMPWDFLDGPSLRLGILKAVLDRQGIPCEVWHLYVDWMEHCRSRTRSLEAGQPISVDDYGTVAGNARWGVGDWVFAVPPFRELPATEEDPLLGHLRRIAPEAAGTLIPRLLRLRELVPPFLAHCRDRILEADPAAVGFSTTFSQTVASLALARMLKAHDPALPIVLGGSNCEGPMGVALLRAFPEIDIVVRGEAESLVGPLFEDLLAGRPPREQPGLCVRRDGQVVVHSSDGGPMPMDEIPTPVFDDYFERLRHSSFGQEMLDGPSLPMESSRGCWWGEKHHCTFCGLNGATMAFRKKSPDRVLSELVELSGKHRLLRFQTVDNIIAMSYFRDVLPRIGELGLDLNLFYETKANLTREQVRLLRHSGVRSIQPGIESFSSAILALMDKGSTGLQNIRLLKWCEEYGVDASWNLLFGFPGEPPEAYTTMAEVMESLTHLRPPLGLYRLDLDRFSPYFRRPAEYGIEILGPSQFYAALYPFQTELLADLAYHFSYRYSDGRDPESYVGPTRRVIERWKKVRRPAHTLQHHHGPGFLRVVDRRFNLPNAVYTLDEVEAEIYLACDAGATPASLAKSCALAAARGLSPGDVEEFLDSLVDQRLIYRERGRYLSLSTAADPSAAERKHRVAPDADASVS